jgi:hypothetical protein
MEWIRKTITSPLQKFEIIIKALKTQNGGKQIQTAYAYGYVMYQIMCMAHARVSEMQHDGCS